MDTKCYDAYIRRLNVIEQELKAIRKDIDEIVYTVYYTTPVTLKDVKNK
jgi:uncharacterized protein (UPF0335 family)